MDISLAPRGAAELKDKLSRVVANYLVIELLGKAGQLASLARSRLIAA